MCVDNCSSPWYKQWHHFPHPYNDDFGLVKKIARWVTKLLTNDQKQGKLRSWTKFSATVWTQSEAIPIGQYCHHEWVSSGLPHPWDWAATVAEEGHTRSHWSKGACQQDQADGASSSSTARASSTWTKWPGRPRSTPTSSWRPWAGSWRFSSRRGLWCRSGFPPGPRLW